MDDATLDRLNAEIAHRIRAETPYVPSTTQVAGRFAIRPCYINPRTTVTEVDGLARSVRAIGDRIVGESVPPQVLAPGCR
jgi:aromatic-L-amino-acid decarboxylase